MQLNIELLANSLARYSGEKVICLPETLSAVFTSPVYLLSEMIITVQNGQKVGRFKVKDQTLDLSEFAHEGEINMTISLVCHGQKAKEWILAPVIIREVEGKIYAFDEITELKEQIKKLAEAVKAIKKEIDEQFI